jgi:hypothetical protein
MKKYLAISILSLVFLFMNTNSTKAPFTDPFLIQGKLFNKDNKKAIPGGIVGGNLNGRWIWWIANSAFRHLLRIHFSMTSP